MTKFASLKKVLTKIILVKRNLALNDLGFLCYSAKATTSHFLVLSPSRWEIDETVNFRKFRKLFRNKYAAFLRHYGTPFSNGKKRNEVAGRAHMMLQWPSLVHWRS